MLRSALIALLPGRLRIFIRGMQGNILRRLKAPRMVWGYKNNDGEWLEKTRISDTVFFNHPEKISIGNNSYIGHHCILDGTGGLEIGEGCQLAAWNGLYTHSSHAAIRLYGKHYCEIPEYEKKGFNVSPIRLGKYVFVGAGAIILPGVVIGDGALIAAGAVVLSDVPEFSIASGAPAKIVGDTRALDKSYLEDAQLHEWYLEWQKP